MTAIPLTCPECTAPLISDRWFSTGLAKIRVPWVEGVFVDQGRAIVCGECGRRVESCLSEAEEVEQAKAEKKESAIQRAVEAELDAAREYDREVLRRTTPPEAEEDASWRPPNPLPWSVSDYLAGILPKPGSTWRFGAGTSLFFDVQVTKLAWTQGRAWVVYATDHPTRGQHRDDLGTWIKHATWISDPPNPDPAGIISKYA